MRRKSRMPYFIAAGALLLVAPIIWLAIFASGIMLGQEFSPDDFTTREFTYNHVRWLNWTLSGIEYSDRTSPLQRSLTADGWIVPNGPATKTWHLVWDIHQPKESGDYDARYLTRFLDSQEPWLAFNNDQPEKAKLFWPIVAELARDEMYLYLPPIMQLGLEESKDGRVKAFDIRLRRLVADAYRMRARTRSEQQRLEESKADSRKADVYSAPQKSEQPNQNRPSSRKRTWSASKFRTVDTAP